MGQSLLRAVSEFDAETVIQTTLCSYEVWANNRVKRREVSKLQLRFYNPGELDPLLRAAGFDDIKQFGLDRQASPTERDATILYEAGRPETPTATRD